MKILRLAVVAALITAIVAAVAFPLGAKNAPMITTFLGRFHVLALHAPIGVLVLALAAEAFTFHEKGRDTGDTVVGFALPLLVFTGVGAVVLGLFLAHGGHYPHKLVAPHRNLTIIGLCLAGGSWLIWSRRPKNRWLHRGLLGAGAAVMSIGAHFGGSITHGADYLTAPIEATPTDRSIVEDTDAGALPSPSSTPALVDSDAGPNANAVGATDAAAPAADAAAAAASAVSVPVDAGPPKPTSKQLAQAVVNRKCNPCHTVNQKGGLRIADVSKPNKRGVLVPGNPDSSSMYTRLLLPKDDDDHMPPENEAQLTKAEINAIRTFIAEAK